MIDTAKMISAARIRSPELIEYAQRAKRFLLNLGYWISVDEEHLAWGVLGIVGVFYVRVTPRRVGIDNELWVVVGDLPPAYLVCDKLSDWQEALDTYVGEMEQWVRQLVQGAPSPTSSR